MVLDTRKTAQNASKPTKNPLQQDVINKINELHDEESDKTDAENSQIQDSENEENFESVTNQSTPIQVQEAGQKKAKSKNLTKEIRYKTIKIEEKTKISRRNWIFHYPVVLILIVLFLLSWSAK